MNSLPEIKERLLSLAREVQAVVPGLYLAGGTAIMIKHEHRIRTDLDLFTEKGGLSRIESRVRRRFGPEIERIVHFPGGDNVDLFVRGIKASFNRFPFPNVEPTETMGGVKLASESSSVTMTSSPSPWACGRFSAAEADSLAGRAALFRRNGSG